MRKASEIRQLRRRNAKVILIAMVLWGVLIYTQIAKDRLSRPIDLFEDEDTVFTIVVPPSSKDPVPEEGIEAEETPVPDLQIEAQGPAIFLPTPTPPVESQDEIDSSEP